jgi:hypothetical protein
MKLACLSCCRCFNGQREQFTSSSDAMHRCYAIVSHHPDVRFGRTHVKMPAHGPLPSASPYPSRAPNPFVVAVVPSS